MHNCCNEKGFFRQNISFFLQSSRTLSPPPSAGNGSSNSPPPSSSASASLALDLYALIGGGGAARTPSPLFSAAVNQQDLHPHSSPRELDPSSSSSSSLVFSPPSPSTSPSQVGMLGANVTVHELIPSELRFNEVIGVHLPRKGVYSLSGRFPPSLGLFLATGEHLFQFPSFQKMRSFLPAGNCCKSELAKALYQIGNGHIENGDLTELCYLCTEFVFSPFSTTSCTTRTSPTFS